MWKVLGGRWNKYFDLESLVRKEGFLPQGGIKIPKHCGLVVGTLWCWTESFSREYMSARLSFPEYVHADPPPIVRVSLFQCPEGSSPASLSTEWGDGTGVLHINLVFLREQVLVGGEQDSMERTWDTLFFIGPPRNSTSAFVLSNESEIPLNFNLVCKSSKIDSFYQFYFNFLFLFISFLQQ